MPAPLALASVALPALGKLVPVLMKVGAPVAGTLLQGAIGSKNASVVNSILQGLGGVLGVEPEPRTIVDAIEADSDAASKVSAADAQMMESIARLGETQLRETHATWRQEVLSNDRVQRWWRPLGAYELYAECFMVAATFCYLLIAGKLDMLKVVVDYGWVSVALATMYWAGRFGLLGVYIVQRSQEQLQKAEALAPNPPIASNLDQLGDMLKRLAPAARR